jgi:hypothetical protein
MIEVDHSFGAGEADGSLHMTFVPASYELQTDHCGRKRVAARGALTGRLRLRADDRYFSTISASRLAGTATAESGPTTCLLPCVGTYDLANVQSSLSGAGPSVGLDARDPHIATEPGLAVSVTDTSPGSPFLDVSHVLSALGAQRYYEASSDLGSAQARAPGGALSGSLALAATSAPRSDAYEPCRNGRHAITRRDARVVGGAITARFDTVGIVTVHAGASAGFPGETYIARAPRTATGAGNGGAGAGGG